jgi:cytoskeletal protein CcmA (bactofilin family)
MWTNRTNEPNPNDLERVSEGTGRVANVAVIGKGMIIKGEIKSKESLHVDGEVEGTLYMSECRLTVSREGKLGANVKAREIELMGVAEGDLEATSKITIRKGARLVGDLRAPGILIEEGAYVKGKIEIINNTEAAQANAPLTKAPQSNAAQSNALQPNARKAAAG